MTSVTEIPQLGLRIVQLVLKEDWQAASDAAVTYLSKLGTSGDKALQENRAAAATSRLVTFESPCFCRDAHGKARLAVKNARQLRVRNRRSHLPGYAAWEIHPVMKIAVND